MNTTTKQKTENQENDQLQSLYSQLWNKDKAIHVGIFKKEKMSIPDGSENTIKRMLRLLPKFKKSTKFLDLNLDNGETAIYLAKKYECKITCLATNDSRFNYIVKKVNQAELDNYITVEKGTLESLPFVRESYDIVWSQDALYTSEEKAKVFREVSRVLNAEGRFIFTDFIKKESGAFEETMEFAPVQSFHTSDEFMRLARKTDMEKVYYKEMPNMLSLHFQKLNDKIEKTKQGKVTKNQQEVLDHMTQSIKAGIDAVNNEQLTWGIAQFQKRNVWI